MHKKEFEKTPGGLCKLPQAHEKCAMKMKEKKKERNDAHVKMVLMEGS